MPPRSAITPQPANRVQLLIVDMVLLAALAILLNREAVLPLWARPEAYRWKMAGVNQLNRWERAGLRGLPDLLVADSEGLGCGWEVDALVGVAASVSEITALFRRQVYGPDRPRYRQIILFVGTGPLSTGTPPALYVEEMTELIELAQLQGDHVFVVSPFAYTRAERPGTLAVVDTTALVRGVVEELRLRFPHVPVYDMNDFRGVVAAHGNRKRLLPDGVHLNRVAYRLLAQELAPLGLKIDPG